MMLEQVASYLVAAGLGTEGVDLFLGEYPDLPDALAALIETPGGAPLFGLQDGPPLAESPRLQVLVRALDYPTARARAQAITDALNGVANMRLDGVRYLSCTAVNSPFLLERDANNRPLICANFAIEKEPG